MREPLSRVQQCDICLEEKLTNRAVLPDGWIITWGYSCILCDKCMSRWYARWGEEPEYFMKGGEKNLELPNYNIEEL